MTEVEAMVVPSFSAHRPLIAVSKKSCPICVLVFEKMWNRGIQISSFGQHHHLFPVSFPPVLPISIMEDVIGEFCIRLLAVLQAFASQRQSSSSNQSPDHEAVAVEHKSDSSKMLDLMETTLKDKAIMKKYL